VKRLISLTTLIARLFFLIAY